MTDETDECLAAMRRVSTATLTTCCSSAGCATCSCGACGRWRAMRGNLVGPAFTLRNIPAREDLDRVGVFARPEHPQRKAIESVPAGHVLVIDCRGETHAACGGQILMTRLMVRGVAGLVSDGGCATAGRSRRWRFPGVLRRAGRAAEPGACITRRRRTCRSAAAALPVYPGDIIVGDDEGVVVVPAHLAAEVAAEAAEQEKMETFIIQRVRDGAAAGRHLSARTPRPARNTRRGARNRADTTAAGLDKTAPVSARSPGRQGE